MITGISLELDQLLVESLDTLANYIVAVVRERGLLNIDLST